MKTLIRARDLLASRRHEEWRNIVCETLGPLDLRIGPDVPLRGQIEAGSLGPLGVGRVQTSTPHSVHRTPRLIRKDSPELYRVVLAMSGNPYLSQDGRSVQLEKGEFAIYDFGRPYELAYRSAVQLAVFSVPREMFGASANAVAKLTAVPISTDSGAGALAGPLLRRVVLDLDTYQPASAARLSTVVMDLISTAVAERADQVEALPEESRARMLLQRIHAFIEQHLGEPDLDPGTVAAANHVSLRQLHRLFESQNATVATWIRHRRLERCRKDLSDPDCHRMSVSSIASNWGLVDSAHFSRLFRQQYGLPPAEYRRSCLLPGT